ncbi:substrate-binding domain-containing protein [Maribacter sp. 4G9]|uniref:substrate-binding domain-containing protein n=1 Tax=Maribacter sp. 4G9 TaxID=1889777 RepID=UPI000C1453B5|nr:substrate-binding domain-containing protein [Maribacter sp. 4G9]PIB25774.1 ABC transporter substrate-binding protein [Maribacter sp. 4G9]
MKTVKIVGVPEHFNLPWHLAIEEGAFEDRGIDLQWEDIPEGTGRMCKLLADGQTDMAIILTEGIVKSITEGNQVKIIQEFIASPLLWGVHVSANSDFKKLGDLRDTKAAISRYGSGSHLMAFVQAQNEGWDPNILQFEVINNLDGAIKGLSEGTADYFMWEHFTTKPIVDAGVFRRLGDCPTPWPCFMLVGTSGFIQENPSIVDHIKEVINLYTTEFKEIPSIDRTLANKYGQKLEDIQEWLALTYWSQKKLPKDVLGNVLDTLLELKLIDKKLPMDSYLANG